MNEKCNFCSGTLIPTGHSCHDNSNLMVTKCKVCDLIQLGDFSHVSLEYYSRDDYFQKNLEDARKKEQAWNRKRVNKLLKLIPNIKSKQLLDYGCGHGGFLEQSQNRLDVFGFDVVSEAIAITGINNRIFPSTH